MSNANGKSDVTPMESETTCTVGHLSRRSRETPAISVSSMEGDRSEKARGHNSEWRKREAQGEVTVIRYADDFVIGFREESDARRCLAALKERFAKFGLELHPDKTRLVRVWTLRRGTSCEAR